MRLEKKATVVSTTVAAILVLMKTTVGILSGSIAVLASAIDSFLDLIVSMFNYFALNTAEKNPDDKFNYGKSKLEPLAAVVEGTIISFSAIFILYEALVKIAHPREMSFMQSSIWVMAASLIITLGLVLFLNFVAKKTNNMVIKADALHYKTDLLSNGAILLALALIAYTGEQLIDPILGVLIALYMIYSAIPIIKDGILMLLDVALPEEDIQRIQDVLESEELNDYHYLKTRISGSHIFISVHAVFNVSVSLYDAHLVADRVEAKIKALFDDNKIVHTLIHMDPYDDSEINDTEEGY
ncbi:cation transporter [Sulfurimonas hongkongensis]|uniref:Cation transporter n=1 Tax=Sulfurimonas hongkongensis TaxID=1172190 RepID=T0KQA4_9BACT|nr:cation diffusion facilitator family transporter [Sulfurimonas hongkongensis]EQB35488.1 cation transporter [Sulfurimonas hongkongensis]